MSAEDLEGEIMGTLIVDNESNIHTGESSSISFNPGREVSRRASISGDGHASGFRTQLKRLGYIIRHLEFGELLGKLKHRLHSETVSYCLRRDVNAPFSPPNAKIPLSIRPLRQSDIPVLLNLDRLGISAREKKENMDRLMFVQEGVRTCYVAADQNDVACYMQWLIGHEENDNLQRIFHGGMPTLERDEALLEDAFTPESHRGLGIMSCAMAHIAERARDINARYVITFVDEENIPSLKGCKRAGFVPYKLRRETNFLFNRRITFTTLPEGTQYPFDVVKS